LTIGQSSKAFEMLRILVRFLKREEPKAKPTQYIPRKKDTRKKSLMVVHKLRNNTYWSLEILNMNYTIGI